jgi:hypothetical protein
MSTEPKTWASKPPEWSDDERMNALFSPFRARELNPIYFDAKLKFWKKAINAYLTETQTIKFKVRDLEEAFVRNGMKPKCLDIVLDSILNDTCCQIKERNSLLKQQSWLTFAFTRLVWSPLSWTTSYLISKTALGSQLSFANKHHQATSTKDDAIDDNDMRNHCEYVFLEQLTVKADEVYTKLNADLIFNDIDCICDYDRFVAICSCHDVPLDDIDLILTQLVNDKRVLVNTSLVKNKKLIKFMPIIDSESRMSASRRPLADITDLEFNYYLLKLNESNMERQVDALNRQLTMLMDQVKANLKLKNKKLALNCLKKYKNYEKQMDQKSNVLYNLQNLMLNLQQISTNKITIDMYKKNLGLIKAFNDENGLDRVEDLMDNLNENFKINSEIDDALSRSTIGSGVDDTELEHELNELVSMADQNKSVVHDLSIDDLLNDLPKLSIGTKKPSENKSPKMMPLTDDNDGTAF